MKRFILFALLGIGMPVDGWTQPPPSTDQMVSVDPIRCWWRTSKGAVRIGEMFDLTLTCAVLENEMVQVVPDESRLGGAVIAMAPYEVIASGHPEDLHRGARRFFQYQYTMRIINPDAIGSDVPIPIMTLHYRVNSQVSANAALQGRDLTYVLPPASVRVLSLVTADAVDIRDSSDEGFSIIEALIVRAGVFEVAAITFAALGTLMVIVVLVRLLAGFRKGETSGKQLMGDYAVLRKAGRELAAVGREADAGWTDVLARRAAAATRIAAAPALGRSVSQRPAAAGSPAGDGLIVARPLFAPRKAIALSSSTTSEDVTRALDRLPVTAPPARRQTLDDLQTALTAFGRALYGREAATDRTALDGALASAIAATKRLKSEAMWPKPQLRRLAGRPTAQEQRA